MVAEKLEQWTFEEVKNLIEKGFFESDRFDFKEDIPRKEDHVGKNRLEKTSCAFANTKGGFLIFGVKDDRTLPKEVRVSGISKNRDFPREFGEKINNVEPFLDFKFLNPPIELPNTNRVIHVIEIKESISKPHMTSKDEFYYRTNKGNIKMDYFKIKESFIHDFRRIEKIKLFYNELLRNRELACGARIDIKELKKTIPICHVDFSVIRSLLFEIEQYNIDKEIIRDLKQLTETMRIVEEYIRIAQLKITASDSFTRKPVKKMNEAMNTTMNIVIHDIDILLMRLEKTYKDILSIKK